MEKIHWTFGEWLNHQMKEKNISGKALSVTTGYSASSISMYINHLRTPDQERIHVIEEALDFEKGIFVFQGMSQEEINDMENTKQDMVQNFLMYLAGFEADEYSFGIKGIELTSENLTNLYYLAPFFAELNHVEWQVLRWIDLFIEEYDKYPEFQQLQTMMNHMHISVNDSLTAVQKVLKFSMAIENMPARKFGQKRLISEAIPKIVEELDTYIYELFTHDIQELAMDIKELSSLTSDYVTFMMAFRMLSWTDSQSRRARQESEFDPVILSDVQVTVYRMLERIVELYNNNKG